MRTRIRHLFGLFVLLLACSDDTAFADAAAARQRFVYLTNDESVGAIVVQRTGDRIQIDYQIDDNGRGPKLRESLRLDAQGRPLDWSIEGAGYAGARVRE